MTGAAPLPSLLSGLWSHLSRKRRLQAAGAVVLSAGASFAEVISIGAVLPFLAVLTAPETVFDHAAAQPVIQRLGITDPQQLVLPMSVAFASAAILAGAVRLLVLYVNTRLAFSIGVDVGIQMFRRTLYQPYPVHVSRNSSEIINGIFSKTAVVINGIVLSGLTILNTAVTLAAILATLFLIQPVVALSTVAVLGTIYGGILWLTRPKLRASSHTIARDSTQVIKILQESLGGIRDILVYGSQEAYSEVYRNAEVRLRSAQAWVVLIGGAPRYIMEALGIAFLAALAYLLATRGGGVAGAIPVIGTFALAAQKLLPLAQQGYGALSHMKACQVSLSDAVELMNQPLPDHAELGPRSPVSFSGVIELRNVHFRYTNDGPWVFRDFNVKIAKGSRIGITGVTGSGKSTLTDLIMGLLEPTKGHIVIDGEVITSRNRRSWQEHIAHVSQSIFLSDSSIMENIAFGVPRHEIEQQRVLRAAREAKILDLIESWPQKFETVVGERGVSLSGGQRQRVGIARALYRRADVIILDEATSALDDATESAVMQSIYGLSAELTILIIAHRLTTLRGCDYVLELGDNGVVQQLPAIHGNVLG